MVSRPDCLGWECGETGPGPRDLVRSFLIHPPRSRLPESGEPPPSPPVGPRVLLRATLGILLSLAAAGDGRAEAGPLGELIAAELVHRPPAERRPGTTAPALLAAMSWGYDHRTPNRFREHLQTGLEQLRAAQDESGALSSDPHAHVLATMALGEAYAMTNHDELAASAQWAMLQLVTRAREGPAGAAYGWSLPADSRAWSTTDTLLAVMALRALEVGGIEGTATTLREIERWLRWVDREWQRDGQHQARFPATVRWTPADGFSATGDGRIAALGIAVWLRMRRDDPLIQRLAAGLDRPPPDHLDHASYLDAIDGLELYTTMTMRYRLFPSAHRQWYQRLKPAIATGSLRHPPEKQAWHVMTLALIPQIEPAAIQR